MLRPRRSAHALVAANPGDANLAHSFQPGCGVRYILGISYGRACNLHNHIACLQANRGCQRIRFHGSNQRSLTDGQSILSLQSRRVRNGHAQLKPPSAQRLLQKWTVEPYDHLIVHSDDRHSALARPANHLLRGGRVAADVFLCERHASLRKEPFRCCTIPSGGRGVYDDAHIPPTGRPLSAP